MKNFKQSLRRITDAQLRLKDTNQDSFPELNIAGIHRGSFLTDPAQDIHHYHQKDKIN